MARAIVTKCSVITNETPEHDFNKLGFENPESF